MQIPSLKGLVPYKVEETLKNFAVLIGGLESMVKGRATLADLDAVQRRQRVIETTLASLQRQIYQITRGDAQARAAAAGEPVPLGGVGAGSALPSVELANLLSVVQAYAAANPAELAASCVPSGGTWDFMDGVVAALAAVDPRVGFNGKRGNPSDPSGDAVAYYHGALPAVEQSLDVYVVDIIGGHCGATPSAAWNDVTTPAAAGMYLSARP